jgi:Protein of unknown function (DUF2911)/Tetratricopeptide repeat
LFIGKKKDGFLMRGLSILNLVVLAGLSFTVSGSSAQSQLLDLPRDSQHGTVIQRVGITDITINYHRPLVKGRQIWGKVVPYGEVWRAGANENTTITFTDPVTIEAQPLAGGVYGLHMLPDEKEWTIIFSKVHTDWGSFTYDPTYDALRVEVKPQPSEMCEALNYNFDDVTPDSTIVTLRWEKLAVSLKIGVNVHDIVRASLPRQLHGAAQYGWTGWDDAAQYLLSNKYDLDEALKYADSSIGMEKRYDNLMTKSQILDAMGQKAEAVKTRNEALASATGRQLYYYAVSLQSEGKRDQAFDFFRQAAKRDPNDWLVHDGLARIYSAKGDFDNAVKEMKLSLAGAPDTQKYFPATNLKMLAAKKDINRK